MASMEYYVWFGRGDCSDTIEYTAILNEEQQAAYDRAVMLRLPFDAFPALEDFLQNEVANLEREETENLIDNGDSYAIEGMGREELDPEEINDLVAERDPHTLEFFGLTEMSDEELDEWDANDLDEFPLVCDFVEDFEPESPFDKGYSLELRFSNDPEEMLLGEEEAVRTLTQLFGDANGDYSTIRDYVDRCERLYEGEGLGALASRVALETGHEDYQPGC